MPDSDTLTAVQLARLARIERWNALDPLGRGRLAGAFDVAGTPLVRRCSARHVALALQVRSRVRTYLDAFQHFFGGDIRATVWSLRDRDDSLVCARALLPLVGQRSTLHTWITLRELIGAHGSNGLAMGAAERAEREQLIALYTAERSARRSRRASFAR